MKISAPYKTIKTWWMNRLLAYWIPALFVFDLPETVGLLGPAKAAENVVAAVVLVLFMEHVLFRYKVELMNGSIRYSHGLLGKTIELDKENIVSGRFLPLSPLMNLTSARLKLSTQNGQEYVLTLASFRSSDIGEIIRWMPIDVKRKN